MEQSRRPRFNVRIRTILVAIVIFALALVVAIQQVQVRRQRTVVERLLKLLDAERARNDKLSIRVLEQRAIIERQRLLKSISSQP